MCCKCRRRRRKYEEVWKTLPPIINITIVHNQTDRKSSEEKNPPIIELENERSESCQPILKSKL